MGIVIEEIPGRPGRRVKIDFSDSPSMTKQSHKDECDINVIMRRYSKSGLIQHVNRNQGHYGDYANVLPYREALDRVRNADREFMTLPAAIRGRFENDPAKFLDFVSDPANEQGMRDLGLLPAKPPEPPPAGATGA